MKKIRQGLTYANVMASIAVFLALGGGAYAVTQLDKNSVRSKHIVNSQVRSPDIRAGAVRTSDIRNGGVRTADVANDSLSGIDIADGSVTPADIASGGFVQSSGLVSVDDPFFHESGEGPHSPPTVVTLLNVGPFSIKGECLDADVRAKARVFVTAPPAQTEWYLSVNGGEIGRFDGDDPSREAEIATYGPVTEGIRDAHFAVFGHTLRSAFTGSASFALYGWNAHNEPECFFLVNAVD